MAPECRCSYGLVIYFVAALALGYCPRRVDMLLFHNADSSFFTHILYQIIQNISSFHLMKRALSPLLYLRRGGTEISDRLIGDKFQFFFKCKKWPTVSCVTVHMSLRPLKCPPLSSLRSMLARASLATVTVRCSASISDEPLFPASHRHERILGAPRERKTIDATAAAKDSGSSDYFASLSSCLVKVALIHCKHIAAGGSLLPASGVAS